MPMAKAFAATGRRRGNPNWGRPVQLAPVLATEFEKQVQQLGLTKQTCALRLSYETGASATEIGAMYRSGCSVRGESRWSQPSAAWCVCAESNNWGGRGQGIDRLRIHHSATVGGCSTWIVRDDGAAL
jgi:hypothetical protein